MNEFPVEKVKLIIINKVKTLYRGDYDELLKLTSKELTKLQMPSNFSTKEIFVNLIRFLYFKKQHNNISPPYLIDQIWHILLSMPVFYCKVCYCITYNGKNNKGPSDFLDVIIDRNPFDKNCDDYEAHKERSLHTLQIYRELFPNDKNFMFSAIWNEDVSKLMLAGSRTRSSTNCETKSNISLGNASNDNNISLNNYINYNYTLPHDTRLSTAINVPTNKEVRTNTVSPTNNDFISHKRKRMDIASGDKLTLR